MLRVMTWNIDCGTYKGLQKLPRIAQVIQESKVNVVALQEAPRWRSLEPYRDALNMEWHFGAATNDLAIAVLSQFPKVSEETYHRQALERPVVRLTVNWAGQHLNVFGMHLERGAGAKSDEVDSILDIVEPFESQSSLLVGDFNALESHVQPIPRNPGPQVVIQKVLDAGFKDCFRMLKWDQVQAPGYTYATGDPKLRYDYIFASPELAMRLKSCEVVTCATAKEASDHFPVVAEFE